MRTMGRPSTRRKPDTASNIISVRVSSREILHIPDLPDMLKTDLVRAYTSKTPGIKDLSQRDHVKKYSSVCDIPLTRIQNILKINI